MEKADSINIIELICKHCLSYSTWKILLITVLTPVKSTMVIQLIYTVFTLFKCHISNIIFKAPMLKTSKILINLLSRLRMCTSTHILNVWIALTCLPSPP